MTPVYIDYLNALDIAELALTDDEIIGAVEAGLAVLEAGGDFADGLIAYEGKFLGGDTFVSFDRKAVALLTKHGHTARVLA